MLSDNPAIASSRPVRLRLTASQRTDLKISAQALKPAKYSKGPAGKN